MALPILKIEEEILDFWKKEEIFQKSTFKEAPLGDYVFYDGPPFATGLPHYGHIVPSVMKDAIPRYWTMRGYRVARRWGWDCHGLPVENIAEKELHFKDKRDIEKYGIAKFNDYCRVLVMRYVAEWRTTIERIGRWVDLENGYKTMDPDYMESIWWVFKALWEKGMVYKGYKSMHLCPRCGTTLSNFEVTQNYKDVTDISVTAKFALSDEPNTFVLAWTTTPWTLVGNVALAVGRDIDYLSVTVESMDDAEFDFKKGETYIFAATEDAATRVLGVSLNNVLGEVDGGESVDIIINEKKVGSISGIRRFKGSELVGKQYKPLFDYYHNADLKNFENGWRIYDASFVTTEEGTGIVHIAPAFGEEDMLLGKERSLPFIQHVDTDGYFKPEVKEWAGELAKPKGDIQRTDRKVIEYLQARSLVFRTDEYTHSYPHCWRCETPLLNYAADSWFVEVTKIKDQLLANNQTVHWYPDHIKNGRFGKWLEAARDWAVSRNRYWGTPLPVWECESCAQTIVIGSRAELHQMTGQNPDDLHKQFIDPITFPCQSCAGVMRHVPEVFDCWFESGSMPYGEEHYPFERKEHFESHFPADYIAEGLDQTRGWFYTLMVLSTALFNKPVAKHIMVNGIVLAADGTKMSKSKKNFPDPLVIIEQYGADSLRFYLLSSPVTQAENLNFNEKEVREVYNKVINPLLNVVQFYKLYAQENTVDAEPPYEHILDIWISSRLEVVKSAVTKYMDRYDTVSAMREIAQFINELSTWYLRRSRDRFKNETDRARTCSVLRTILGTFARIIAPFMPFTAEHLWKELNRNEFESVHLAGWSKPYKQFVRQDVLDSMEHVLAIVEKAHAERAKAGVKVRQPLSKLEINVNLSPEFRELIADEVNVKSVVEGKEIVLDISLTDELKEEGLVRELIRGINALRKTRGLKPQDSVTVRYSAESTVLQNIVEKYKQEIEKATISSGWAHELSLPEGETVNINNEKITVQL